MDGTTFGQGYGGTSHLTIIFFFSKIMDEYRPINKVYIVISPENTIMGVYSSKERAKYITSKIDRIVGSDYSYEKWTVFH